jgi:hypothetical protein
VAASGAGQDSSPDIHARSGFRGAEDINGSGKIYDRDAYITAVRSHELTYSSDLQLTETDHRVDGSLVILVGMMLGHARLDGEQQVYHLSPKNSWGPGGHGTSC